jgi:hypothetical protein
MSQPPHFCWRCCCCTQPLAVKLHHEAWHPQHVKACPLLLFLMLLLLLLFAANPPPPPHLS